MKINIKFFHIFLILIFVFLIVSSENSSKYINWYPSYSVHHKIPLGSFIIHQEAKDIFKGKFHEVNTSPYIFLNNPEHSQGNYIFYNSEFNLGWVQIQSLLNWVKKGNQVFIFAEKFPSQLMDTLNFIQNDYLNKTFKDSISVGMVSIPHRNFLIKKRKPYHTVLQSKDSTISQLTTLGYFDNNPKLINFTQIKYGNGSFFIHSFPQVLTNYFILNNNNYLYVNKLLDLMANKYPIYWDVHYQNGVDTQGVFNVLRKNKAFLWAYQLFFIGIIIFILFQGKRSQRAIPIYEPPKNESLHFTKNIAEMYWENKEQEEIISLQIKIFYDWLQNKTNFLPNQIINNDIIEKIASQTKTEVNDVKKVFEMIDYLKHSAVIQAKDVLKLDELIRKIKKI